jgi:predicted membrane-bound spermidine synthase
MPQLDAARRRFLLAIFVVSGFTGLIYESIWSHYLKLFLGHAAYAQTLVLAIFMGGLALGSWLVARYCTRLRNLLWGYLLVEALTGILGVLFHRVFVAASDFSFNTVIPALPTGAAIYAYKWALAALLILPQSTLLGMTFPLISGGLIRRWPERAGETLATLYFTNSLGAALGVLVSGFVLIAMVGLPGTVLTAGLLNVILALAVWVIVRRDAEPAPEGAMTTESTPQSPDKAAARWFVVAAFLTGVASFMYELGWIRMLSLVLGSATHSFELMLAAFIFGLAVGGLYVRKRVERIASPETYLGGVMAVMGALAALTLPAWSAMFDFMAWGLATFTHTDGGYVAFNVVSQTIAILIMVPTTVLAGMTLPVLTHALMRRGGGERAIGTVYAVNTLGAIVGVLLTVHVLMPSIGIKGVILTGAAVHIALGLSRIAPRQSWRAGTVGVLAASVAAFGFVAVYSQLDPRRVASGVFRTARAMLPADTRVTYLRDGKTATVSLAEQRGLVWIATNGKTDAGVRVRSEEPSLDERTVALLAAIPLSMHPHPARVANIGFGSGLTAHTLLTSDRVERLDTIEIEPVMVEAAHQGFGPRIRDVFEDPRSHIVYDDAKTFFATTRQPYDLIISEPSNPWVSGVATLFSQEFYGRVAHYLRHDGLFAQWVQIYETDINVVASITKALSAQFGAYAIYNLDDSNILLVATPASVLPTPSERVFQWPRMRAELERIGVQSVDDLRLRLIGDRSSIDPILKTMSVPANSDFFPFVDLNGPRLRFLQQSASQLPLLTFMSAPFQDIVRADWPGDAVLAPSERSNLVRDRYVREALRIHRALSTGRIDDLDSAAVSAVLFVDLSAQRCTDTSALNAWSAAVRRISDLTGAYLDASKLQDIWRKIQSSPCYQQPGEHRTWADLFAAVARRDATEIVSLGTQLVHEPHPVTREDLTYLTTLSAAAYLRLGQPAQARQVLESRWASLDRTGEYDLPLRQLLALAHTSAPAALARAGE